MEAPRPTVGRTHVDSIHELEDVTICLAFNPCRRHGDSNPMWEMDLDHIFLLLYDWTRESSKGSQNAN
jgi:hypothetical protein